MILQPIDVEQLWVELQQNDENSRIEAKCASYIGTSIMQTICAFANEIGLGSGYLLLGVSKSDEEYENYWFSDIQNL